MYVRQGYCKVILKPNLKGYVNENTNLTVQQSNNIFMIEFRQFLKVNRYIIIDVNLMLIKEVNLVEPILKQIAQHLQTTYQT